MDGERERGRERERERERERNIYYKSIVSTSALASRGRVPFQGERRGGEGGKEGVCERGKLGLTRIDSDPPGSAIGCDPPPHRYPTTVVRYPSPRRRRHHHRRHWGPKRQLERERGREREEYI